MPHSPKVSAIFDNIKQTDPDPIFFLNQSYLADADPNKINLGIGAYRDDSGKPWILPVVKDAEHQVVNNKDLNHEYLPIQGLQAFTDAASKLIYGDSHPAVLNNQIAAIQTISGTGAVSLAAKFLNQFYPDSHVYLSDPTWGNHKSIFLHAGYAATSIKEYKYYHASTNELDLQGILGDLNRAMTRSVIVLHACAHNPTGIDPSKDQWQAILDVVLAKQHIVLFDCAYQGFASGDLDSDAYAVRLFSTHMELLCCQSFAKNFGLYNERIGQLSVLVNDSSKVAPVMSHLTKIQRGTISNPPAFGARIVSTVLNTPKCRAEWVACLKQMADRITSMRALVFDRLDTKLKTPGSWVHIKNQIGMFSYTGLSVAQAQTMRSKFHVYMPDSGRISMAGLNSSNVDYFASSFDWVVRNVRE